MSFITGLSLRDQRVADAALRALVTLGLKFGQVKTAHHEGALLVIHELVPVKADRTTVNCVGASSTGGVLHSALENGYELAPGMREELLVDARLLAESLVEVGSEYPGGVVLLSLWQESGNQPLRLESVFAVDCADLDADHILNLPIGSGLRLS